MGSEAENRCEWRRRRRSAGGRPGSIPPNAQPPSSTPPEPTRQVPRKNARDPRWLTQSETMRTFAERRRRACQGRVPELSAVTSADGRTTTTTLTWIQRDLPAAGEVYRLNFHLNRRSGTRESKRDSGAGTLAEGRRRASVRSSRGLADHPHRRWLSLRIPHRKMVGFGRSGRTRLLGRSHVHGLGSPCGLDRSRVCWYGRAWRVDRPRSEAVGTSGVPVMEVGVLAEGRRRFGIERAIRFADSFLGMNANDEAIQRVRVASATGNISYLLDSPSDPRMRTWAADHLAQPGATEAVRSLMRLLSATDPKASRRSRSRKAPSLRGSP
jgi:hypothetical protein